MHLFDNFFQICLPTSLLFAVHPLHTEPTCEIVGAADLAVSALILSALFVKARICQNLKNGLSPALEVVTFSSVTLIAVLFKEQGIMLIPMVLSLEFCLKLNTRRRFPLKIFALKTALYLIVLSCIVFFRMWIINFEVRKNQNQSQVFI